ncbi:MAG: TetR/AcrR family transcriptional regulator [Rhodospirillum sp.]|nr:TetR/AcrR family transcriptional regulator [Rhodospirillum sp.]MCF8491814.1 TetR/AcrR family transcriptional regulator [Rhodospirillum sp.]
MARPRKADSPDIPNRAVTAALSLLAERDGPDFTLAEVARAVGCSVPAFYNHFRDKNALLRAVHDAGFHRLHDDKLALAARTEGSALDRLRAGGHAYMAFALENPALYRLMFSPPPSSDLEDGPLAHDLGRRCLDLLTRAVADSQKTGALPGQDPAVVAFTLWSAVHGAASLILQDRAPEDTASRREAARIPVETLMALITASL